MLVIKAKAKHGAAANFQCRNESLMNSYVDLNGSVYRIIYTIYAVDDIYRIFIIPLYKE